MRRSHNRLAAFLAAAAVLASGSAAAQQVTRPTPVLASTPRLGGTRNLVQYVPTSHPFFRAIEAVAGAGITSGCGGGNFCPNQAVTRGELAKFLANGLGLNWPD